jgi:adenine/guanine phosphoribosyltransferase-like PRPP-binding protein
MSVADQDRVVFQEYAAELGPELSGAWRRERARCILCRVARGVFLGYARAGLASVGVGPQSLKPRTKVPPSGE